MTNEEKYKTVEERVEAYCASKGLSPCTIGYALAVDYFGWLTLEAKEKPEPCPFCGGETHSNLGHLKAGVVHYWVDCISPDCMYRSAHYTDKDAAIAAIREEGGSNGK